MTATAMANGFLCTNDLSYIDDVVCVYLYAHKDNVINYDRIKLLTDEIESAVADSPIV